MATSSIKKSRIRGGITRSPSMLVGNTAFNDAAYELISTTVLSSTTASVVLTISGTQQSLYKHLQIRCVTRTDRSAQGSDRHYINFNSDTGTNYNGQYLYGDGTSAAGNGGFGASATTIIVEDGSYGAGMTASAYKANIYDILDFSNTSKYKTLRGLSGSGGSSRIILNGGLWMSTASISTVTFTALGSFVSGSRFSVYGVRG